ncbi:hypothetical protein O0Q50_21930 [Priestia aryabhattai]|uniref:Uncharacterized protein n=1 Tax=Priestia aryabhattai TaxID=412384 RepID=A0AAX6NDB4_PRIAR|nr:hypothetical protein [Priestia aryabhattai]MDU9693842.1 hypothetical protein [Priestia aryabhattai]
MRSIVRTFEEAVIKDIQKITNYNEIEWNKVYLNGGEIDFQDDIVDVIFYVNDSNDKNKYKFWYDYEIKQGGLYIVGLDKNNSEELTVLWTNQIID